MGSTTQTPPLGAETSVFLVFGITEGTAGLLGEVPRVNRREEDDKFSLFCVVACQTCYVLSSWGKNRRFSCKLTLSSHGLVKPSKRHRPTPLGTDFSWAVPTSSTSFLSLAWEVFNPSAMISKLFMLINDGRNNKSVAQIYGAATLSK